MILALAEENETLRAAVGRFEEARARARAQGGASSLGALLAAARVGQACAPARSQAAGPEERPRGRDPPAARAHRPDHRALRVRLPGLRREARRGRGARAGGRGDHPRPHRGAPPRLAARALSALRQDARPAAARGAQRGSPGHGDAALGGVDQDAPGTALSQSRASRSGPSRAWRFRPAACRRASSRWPGTSPRRSPPSKRGCAVSPSVNADETGLRVEGKARWLWAFTSPRLARFRAETTRSGRVVTQTLGESFRRRARVRLLRRLQPDRLQEAAVPGPSPARDQERARPARPRPAAGVSLRGQALVPRRALRRPVLGGLLALDARGVSPAHRTQARRPAGDEDARQGRPAASGADDPPRR